MHTLMLVVAALLPSVAGLYYPRDDVDLIQHDKRARPDAPDGYAPSSVSCPSSRPTVRAATGLSPQERDWLPRRSNNTISAMKEILARANIGGFNSSQYIDRVANNDTAAVPRIGIAISGGGYRALMNGAGAIAAFDSRTTNATGQGQLGGLLQATTYLSGLSGGSWVVGSIYVQNFTTVESIISQGRLWQFDDTIFEGPDDLSTLEYYNELFQNAQDKEDAGFDVTITDYWGRALSYQLVNANNGGPAYTFSSIAEDTEIVQAQAPLPIILANERPSGQTQIPANATIFEFNPWEFGSFDPGTAAFAPLRYIGSNFTDGRVAQDGECVAGFDNAGFVMGTSSSLFNQALLQITSTSDVPGFLLDAINRTLEGLDRAQEDIALWPNPFYQYNSGSYENAGNRTLALVDGGEALQNIPLHPLTLRDRQVDVIFAVDGSADTTTNWPNGTSLVATYAQSQSGAPSNNSRFPPVPDENTFVNLGLNQRPTFFGCNATDDSSPLIVYLPNYPVSFGSNISTFDLEYSDEDRAQIIENGYNVVTRGNGTLDSAWTTCVGCAVLARSLARTNTDVPPDCVDCFSRYCWNGTTNSTRPATYEPQQIEASESRAAFYSAGMGSIAAAMICMLLII